MELTAHRIHGSGKSLFQVLGRRCQRYFRTERNVSSLQSQVINTKEDADTKRIPRPFKDIPRPKMWPVFGSLLDYTPVGPYTLEKIMEASLDRYREYGKIWVENFMGSIAVNIVDPNDAQTLYKNEGVYPIREAFKPWERAREVRKCPPGLGNMQGSEWRRVRRGVQAYIMKPKLIAQYVPDVDIVVGDFISLMKQIKQEDGEIPNFQSEIYKWSLESIFKVVFDERLGCLYSDIESNYEAKEVFQAAGDFFRTLNKLLLGVPFYKLFNTLEWKKFLHYEEVFYRTSKKYIDLSIARMQELSEKKEIAGEANFLESLLGREDLTYQEMVAVPGDMMLGAIDTTGNALVFNLYTLATNQDKQAKLYDEIINVIGSEGAITSNELDKMVYLKGCIKETSRVFPVASANSRTTTTDMILSGYQVPAGTTVRTQSIAGWLPEYVSEPEKFIPERWIRSDKRREDIHPYVVLPFGFGPRMCMGKRLAEQSLQVVITRLVQNFRIEWHYGEMNMVTRLTQAPGRPASFTFMNRK